MSNNRPKIIVLDDDPTGSQTVHSCLLLMRWDEDTLRLGLADNTPIFFVLTNTRALTPEKADSVTREVCHNLKTALTKLFERHRIVFWYDTEKELRSDFERLELENIEKIEIKNNEFGLKYRVLKEQPQQKFLLYHEGKEPEYLDNWLLDVELAQGKFSSDQVSLWLNELELSPEFADVLAPHREFFLSNKRRESLKQLLQPHDTKTNIRLKMLAVCTAAPVGNK